MTKKLKPADYRHIAAWGRMMGSYPYYIEGQQSRAAEMQAPVDAIYQEHSWDGTGKWHTMSDVTNADTKRLIEQILKA
jgi:hypothetical protein